MKQLKKHLIIGMIFVLIAGSLFHFLYEWTGRNFLAGLFFPVNESVWEHMKLVFFPMLIYSLWTEESANRNNPCLKSALACGILLGTLLIPVIFYTYSGILGYHTLILDLLTFAASVIIAFYAVYRLVLSCISEKYSPFLYIAVGIFILLFFIFSIMPPAIGLFKAPVQ